MLSPIAEQDQPDIEQLLSNDEKEEVVDEEFPRSHRRGLVFVSAVVSTIAILMFVGIYVGSLISDRSSGRNHDDRN